MRFECGWLQTAMDTCVVQMGQEEDGWCCHKNTSSFEKLKIFGRKGVGGREMPRENRIGERVGEKRQVWGRVSKLKSSWRSSRGGVRGQKNCGEVYNGSNTRQEGWEMGDK